MLGPDWRSLIQRILCPVKSTSFQSSEPSWKSFLSLAKTRCSISVPPVPKRSSAEKVYDSCHGFAWLPSTGANILSNAASSCDRTHDASEMSFVPCPSVEHVLLLFWIVVCVPHLFPDAWWNTTLSLFEHSLGYWNRSALALSLSSCLTLFEVSDSRVLVFPSPSSRISASTKASLVQEHNTVLSSTWRVALGLKELAARKYQWIHDVHQMKKLVPLNTCETSFGQNVQLVFGVNISDLNSRIEICSVKQPINCDSVGLWPVSHCWTSAFNNHLDYRFSVFKHVQLRLTLGCVVYIQQLFNISVVIVLYFGRVLWLTTVSHRFQILDEYCSWNTILLSPHHINREQLVHPFEIQQDADACFLHIQLIRTNVRLPKMLRTPP